MTRQQPVGFLLPSFSIVLETENLANADVKGLGRSLASLDQQNLSPTQANEVFLIDSGETPRPLLASLCQQYSWLQIQVAPPRTTYYKAKMLGAAAATGDIIVYYDSDCLYQPDWLRLMLQPFSQNEQIQVVAGETTTRGWGPYGTAMAIAYIFPQFSGDTELTPTTQYFLNNVAFRRKFLLQHPIPTGLPLYRGNCVIHAAELQQQGHIIWKQPLAKTLHAPPNGLTHFCWRFLLIGHDYYWQQRLLKEKERDEQRQKTDVIAASAIAPLALRAKLGIFGDRLSKMIAANPRHLLYLPFALPIALAAALLIYLGYLITSLQPKLLSSGLSSQGGRHSKS